MKDIFDGGPSHGHVSITNGLHLTELGECELFISV
jgi:hypothetical protein